MTRRLKDLQDDERQQIVDTIHREAQDAGWHTLGNARKSVLYHGWSDRFDLTHHAIKDGVMKGFDVAQGIPRAGEAAVHAEVLDHLRNSSIPFVGSKTKLWGRRAQADFVLGYSRTFLSHTVELESVTTWQVGLTQALWYKSAYFHECRVQATPTLILFGDVSAQRWNEIDTTCLDQRVLVVPFRLFVDGSAAQRDLLDLLR